MLQFSKLIGLLCCLSVVNAKAQIAERYQILITEIMADPSPQVQLPGNEWVELRNTSAVSFNLQGWRIGDASGLSGAMPNYLLKPDSMVIVCTGSAVAAMQAYGPTIAVTSFPSLDNGGDLLYLRSPQGRVIHAVAYTDAWYKNDLKKDGGWSLEMMDVHNPCSGIGNWAASTHASGGTPGKSNAIAAANPDTDGPQLLRAYATDSVNIILLFNEPLDSLKAATVIHYAMSDGINIQSATCLVPSFDKVSLRLSNPLMRNKIYTVTVNTNVSDCTGNAMGSNKTARVGIAMLADSMDVVINEILFNPRPNGTDYVEIYIRSNKVIDMKQLHLANRSSTGQVSNIKQLSSDSYLLFPQDYMVIAEEPALVKAQYIAQNLDAFLALPGMPSYSDDKGNVVLLNAQGKVVDELAYNEKWHHPLIDNREGVSLERIDYDAATQNPENWHSAATSVGYGTPTYKNSHYRTDVQLKGTITISPEICSPNNDGMDDFVTISYQFSEPGYMANITVFDAAGLTVRFLQRNALCGINDSYRWDGLGEKNQTLPSGIYIVYTEVFNLKGKTKRFKNTVVLVRGR
jgi:Lamin Tail Domain/Bacterial Ig-like domain/CHU_C Type IX secretion signal domain